VLAPVEQAHQSDARERSAVLDPLGARLYSLLYMSRRIPRWLSAWGLIGAPLMLAAGFSLAITGDPNSTVSSIMYAPLALQEMVLAVWLIVKGFNPPAIASGTAKTATSELLSAA
jgi:hypothetical protein